MTPEQLIQAAEIRLADAERNLSGCIESLNIHKQRQGGVPNAEVLALTHAQATIAQAYAALAMAKTARQMLTPAPEPAKPEVSDG